IDLAAALEQLVLHVDFVRLIAREGDIDAMEHAALAIVEPLGVVEEIGDEVALAEEQPIASARTERITLGNETAKRRDPRAGADHDHGCVGIGGQAEVRIAMQIDRYGRAIPARIAELLG